MAKFSVNALRGIRPFSSAAAARSSSAAWAAAASALGLVCKVLPWFDQNNTQIIALLAVLSMFLGSIAGIGQRDIKRLMAYSSVSHVGVALVGFVLMMVSVMILSWPLFWASWVVVALAILAAVGTAMVPLVNALFAPK